MARYYLPSGMRYSTLEERREFYTREFNPEKVVEWLERFSTIIRFAVIIGRHTKIFPEKYKNDASTTIIIDEYKSMNDVRDLILEFLPEAVYYDRSIYKEDGRKVGQELAFDLDPENMKCPIHGTLADKMARGQGLGFCNVELQMVKDQTVKLYEYLEADFEKMKIVYSGRGFHIHVFDQEACSLSVEKRRQIAQRVKEQGFQIDEWVTSGGMRLIRLPFSLHGLVSRIIIPLEKSELPSFDPILDNRCIPNFLQG